MAQQRRPTRIAAPTVGSSGGKELGEALKGIHKAAGIQRQKRKSQNPSRVPTREVLRRRPGQKRLPTAAELYAQTATPAPGESAPVPGMSAVRTAADLLAETAGSTSPGLLDTPVDRTEYLAPTPSINPDRPRAHEASYNPDTRTLRVVFRHGGTYHYFGVPPQTWRALQRNRSFGQTLDRLVINTYEFEKVAF